MQPEIQKHVERRRLPASVIFWRQKITLAGRRRLSTCFWISGCKGWSYLWNLCDNWNSCDGQKKWWLWQIWNFVTLSLCWAFFQIASQMGRIKKHECDRLINHSFENYFHDFQISFHFELFRTISCSLFFQNLVIVDCISVWHDFTASLCLTWLKTENSSPVPTLCFKISS